MIVGEVGGSVAGDPFDAFVTYGPVDGVMAYGFSTETCNVGDASASWVTNGNEDERNNHPVIAQNIFRLRDGRFEQIGQSWLKHGFCVVNLSLCETCSASGGGGCETMLTAGCSDPYGAALNSQYQLYLGPKSDVNSSTGEFPYSDSGICEWCPIEEFTAVFRRLQVRLDDLDPVLNPGAQYFIEGQYVTADDAVAGNSQNNASWRRVVFDPVSLEVSAAVGSATQRREPAIFAWRDVDSAVWIEEVVVPDDGGPGLDAHFWIAAKATGIGGGWWHYEYAVQNQNSDRSAQAFTIPVPATAQVANIGFHDVDYHSGERLDSTDWTYERDGNSITWQTVTFADDEYGNALRWGTLYNFRFDADIAPANGAAELTLFKPGVPAVLIASTLSPVSSEGCACPGDVNSDAIVDGRDITIFVTMYVGSETPNMCADNADPIGGPLDGGDVDLFVTHLLDGGDCD